MPIVLPEQENPERMALHQSIQILATTRYYGKSGPKPRQAILVVLGQYTYHAYHFSISARDMHGAMSSHSPNVHLLGLEPRTY